MTCLAKNEVYLAVRRTLVRLPMPRQRRFEATSVVPLDTHLQIGSLLFEGLDRSSSRGRLKSCRAFPTRPTASTARLLSRFAICTVCVSHGMQLWLTRHNSMCCTCLAASVKKP